MAFFYGVNKEVLPLKVCDTSLLKPYGTKYVSILLLQNVSNLTSSSYIPEKNKTNKRKLIKASLLAGQSCRSGGSTECGCR